MDKNDEIRAAQEVHRRLIAKHFPVGHEVHELDPLFAGHMIADYMLNRAPQPDREEYTRAHYIRLF